MVLDRYVIKLLNKQSASNGKAIKIFVTNLVVEAFLNEKLIN